MRSLTACGDPIAAGWHTWNQSNVRRNGNGQRSTWPLITAALIVP